MTTETKKLHEDRAVLVTEMQSILKTAKDANRDMTKEENEKFDSLDTRQEAMFANITRIEKLADLTGTEKERLIKLAGENKTDSSVDLAAERNVKEKNAFSNFLRFGEAKLNADERTVLSELKNRAQSTTTTAGGYLIPQGFQAELVKSMMAMGGVREVARIINTGTGNTIPWPNMNDTANTGELLAENTQVNELDVTFGVTNLLAYKYSSKAVRVSNELLQDSAINVDGLLAEALGERIARITNTHFTTGDNSSKPQGVVTAAGAGKTTASTSAVTFSEVIDLIHSVDPAYRKNAKFMFNDSTLKALKKLSIGSSDARSLWDPGLFRNGVPPTIDGYGYVINQDMASMASGAKFMLFGDFSYYAIRDVAGMSLKRLVERYADYDQVGYFAFSRHDGRKISSDSPFKYMRNTTT